jgi:hypothetical protein
MAMAVAPVDPRKPRLEIGESEEFISDEVAEPVPRDQSTKKTGTSPH